MDQNRFENIYNFYWEELLEYCFYYCKDYSRSQEIVQDVFLSLWEKRHEFIISGDIKNYLYKAIKYKVFDYFREQNKKQSLVDQLRSNFYDDHCFTEKEVLFNDLTNILDKAVESLPYRCREVFQLSREHGLKYKEIAIQLSISEKTVEQHISKALHLIRKKINSSC